MKSKLLSIVDLWFNKPWWVHYIIWYVIVYPIVFICSNYMEFTQAQSFKFAFMITTIFVMYPTLTVVLMKQADKFYKGLDNLQCEFEKATSHEEVILIKKKLIDYHKNHAYTRPMGHACKELMIKIDACLIYKYTKYAS